jgi:hypothetical protein
MASIGEYSEYKYLEGFLNDAITLDILNKKPNKKYNKIKGYDLSKYQYNLHNKIKD